MYVFRYVHIHIYIHIPKRILGTHNTTYDTVQVRKPLERNARQDTSDKRLFYRVSKRSAAVK